MPAPEFFEVGEVPAVGRSAGSLIFHAGIMRLNCETLKPLILWPSLTVSQPTLYATGVAWCLARFPK
jgi:hypothetical protein